MKCPVCKKNNSVNMVEKTVNVYLNDDGSVFSISGLTCRIEDVKLFRCMECSTEWEPNGNITYNPGYTD